jgi:hypothetical protein
VQPSFCRENPIGDPLSGAVLLISFHHRADDASDIHTFTTTLDYLLEIVFWNLRVYDGRVISVTGKQKQKTFPAECSFIHPTATELHVGFFSLFRRADYCILGISFYRKTRAVLSYCAIMR